MECIKEFLREMIGEKLGVEKSAVDPDAAFFSLGVTSIISEEILAILHQTYQNLSSTLLFEYPNINKLSQFLALQERRPGVDVVQALQERDIQTKTPVNNEPAAKDHATSAGSQEPGEQVVNVFDDNADKAAKSSGYDIAIIGLSGKFPQANDQFEYWRNLVANKDCVEEIPKDRWDYLSFYAENKDGANAIYSRWGGFIDDVDKFDPIFFGISPWEAELMDPQQKLFLMCCWEAMEDAGYGKREYRKTRKIGVFAGVTWNEFSLRAHEEGFLKGQYKGPGSLYWSIPNRVSYFLDVTGPSMAIDTACSSSLVAIHQACQAILAGDCEMALAGGVNLSLHPSKYIFLSDSNFLSTDGKCRSFGEGGDGYVPGEGLGAILLKPLNRAVEDGDYIYGVIRGSATNHGGKTTGYTVPNPEAHCELIVTAIKRAHIHPEDLNYIECHGTGTALGDPIEVRGLTQAFETYTQKKHFCGIGSVKSNIGHLEAAAGVVGLIKVLLSMKYKMLPASIHAHVLNRRIDFHDSPFFVTRDNQEWETQAGKSLVAGVSSFGAGGSNAHLIVESYTNHQSNQTDGNHKQEIIPLSAQSEEQLRQYAEKMTSFISGLADKPPSVIQAYSLRNIAKTLQTGREAYRYRLVVLAASLTELQQNLQNFIHGKADNKNSFLGEALTSNSSVLSSETNPEDRERIAALWVKGEIENVQLGSGGDFLKVPLPTYPFLKEKSWVAESGAFYAGKMPPGTDPHLHPLLDVNISTYEKGRFKKVFANQEYFLKDHLINNHYVLPGVCHLEMASIGGALWGKGKVITINNLWFMNPIAVGEGPEEVQIEFSVEEEDIQFTIQSADETRGLLYSQGRISYSQRDDSEVAPVNLTKLTSTFDKNIEIEEFYRLFASIGIVQKKSFQVVREFFFKEGEAFAKISLPAALEPDFSRYRLHPALMDGAVQTAMAHVLLAQNEPSLIVPFHFGEVEIVKPLTTTVYVHAVRENPLGNQFKLLIFDDQGALAVKVKEFIVKEVKESQDFAFSTAAPGTLMLEPCWQEQAIVYTEAALSPYDKQLAILCEPGEVSRESIETHMNGIAQAYRCLILKSDQENIKEWFQTCTIQVFEEIQSILKDKPKGKVLIQIVVPNREERQLFFGLSGLLKTARLENPKIIGQLIEVEPGEAAAAIAAKLKENSQRLMDDQIRYQDGKRFVADWSEIEAGREEASLPWKDRGIYLITGGAGGLGLIFAQEIARKVKDATLILTGRSPLNEAKQARLKDLAARVEYRQIDVTQEQAVSGLIHSIQEELGTINGIIHSAGVIQDNFILKKTKDEFLAVLAPKVAGLVNIDQATKDVSLDFFVLFSSISGSMGNAGQADYATANVFMDAYAKYRNDLVASKQRRGKTLSINWPLWKEGGMQVDEETEKTMKESMDIIPMATQTGIRALYQGLAFGQSQVMVMEGNVARMKQKLLLKTPPDIAKPEFTRGRKGFSTEAVQPLATQESIKAVAGIGEDILQEKATNYLKKQLSSVIKLPVNRIEADAPLEKYGIDSIMSMKLTNQLEKIFGSLSKTLFFEYQNIKELTGYFLDAYRDRLVELLGIETKAEAVMENAGVSVTVTESVKTVLSRGSSLTAFRTEAREEKPTGALDIAIIGVSGRYPQAKNIREFWQNLRDGKDCITEIPKDRWDHSLYFDEDKNKPGKTYSKWGGFLEGVDQFDPLFFNISPREAELMDPQERLFLECVYETIEDAGYTREAFGQSRSSGLEGNVGVYVGVMFEEYQLYGAQETLKGKTIALWGVPSSIANRVSHFCNFHGPSMAVDTMCSSSLTAIHLACHSLQRGECEVALAGGVNVSVHPNKYLFLAQGKFLSSKGRCESFGEGGDGYVPGEGVGAVLLKPLAKAIADGDHIYGIIKGTAVNHGGKTNGYTVPNPGAQAGVIGRAIKEAGIDPRAISYIEAHGTGTSLGDPIEMAGLMKTFGEYTKDKQFCAIGSVKSNIGHCESAAGIAGVTKVLLQLKHRQLVPSLHAEVLNPNIDFSNTPFVVQQDFAAWERPVVTINGEINEYPRIAGISSFGAGGSNAHLVIEEYISDAQKQPQISITSQNPAIIVLSAKNEERLKKQVQQLLAAIEEQQWTDASLADIAYTFQVGREAMEERLGLIAGSIKEVKEKLQDFMEGQDGIEDLVHGQVKRNKETIAVLAADEDMEKTIDAWITKGKYTKLLELWVKGLVIDWNKLYGDVKPCRISLPTYPFIRERYWVPAMESQSGDNSLTADQAKAVSIAENRVVRRRICFLRKQWEESLPTPAKTLKRTVAILATQETRELAVLLSQYFPQSHILDIQDLALQFPASEEEWKTYDGCVDLIGCGKEKNELLNWTAWLQQFIEYGQREDLMLLCVTKGLETYQNTDVNLSGASRVGLYRMLQSEYGHVRSRHMDADPWSDAITLTQQIAVEFLMDNEDSEICYRHGKRYRAFLQEEQAENKKEQRRAFPENQVLLITGGTRGIGYLCAQHLVTHYGVKRLVLTGRETMPPREQWDAYAGQDTPLGEKILAIQSLETKGAQVQVLSVSLTDEQTVQQSLQKIKNTMGPIGGVIHCAGRSDSENPAFIRKSPETIQQVLDPKVAGLDALYQSLKHEPLQFFILFSSVSGIIPVLGSGQSDYAMANAYMDYFAEAHGHTCPIVSIEWPSWKETGMGEVKNRVYEQTGLLSITNCEGLQLLDDILLQKIGPVVLPAVINPDLWKPELLMQRKIGETVARSRQPIPLAPAALTATDGLAMVTQTWLTELFSQELKIKPSQLEKDTPFQDYGVDSVLLAQLWRRINQLFAEDLEPSILFEYPTIESLTAWLVSTHAASLSQALAPSVSPQPSLLPQDSLPDLPVNSSVRQIPLQVLPKKIARGVNPVDIAVIGLSCRFPGAGTLEEYWQLLSEGRSAIRSVPEERWGYLNKFYAGLLDNITDFDPAFFLLPPEDAKAMDPQALMVLEESLKLWYHAGYSHQEIKGKPVGVYLGARSQHQPDEISLRQARNPIVAIGPNYLAANISQFFDLRGPSIVVDTACSSALVGMNMAIQALCSGEIDSALVGGVSLLTTDIAHRVFHQRGILSHEPHFHIFDHRANGVVLGEGAGMVLLKTVEQAMADGDRIYAVIKAIAVNNDGRTAGPATPNFQAQKEVMQAALAKSGKKAEEISYVEVNGSGTEVTDLLELKAIQSVYRSSNALPLGLGSIKPNIGHPLSAEGIASLIKVVLMLQHQQFVPFLSGTQPMTHYDMEASPFNLCQTLTRWTNAPWNAAINCFADGGTNVHVILEAWEGFGSYQIKRNPLLPPQLNRYDIRYARVLPLAASRPDQNTADAVAINDRQIQHPPYGYPETSGASGNIWKQKIREGT